MSTKIRYEHRKRGMFGWLFLIVFWLFNAGMLILIFSSWLSGGEPLATERLREHFGAAIIPAYFWAVGDMILGLCAYVTRGHRSIVIVK